MNMIEMHGAPCCCRCQMLVGKTPFHAESEPEPQTGNYIHSFCSTYMCG